MTEYCLEVLENERKCAVNLFSAEKIISQYEKCYEKYWRGK